MNTVTHALIPVIAVVVDQGRVRENGEPYWNKKTLALVAIAGALPDLLNPHLSLAARYTSWSHGVPALGGLCFLLVLVYLTRRQRSDLPLLTILLVAYALHLFCDMVAGGIAWWYPFAGSVVGDYYVLPALWIPLDIACLCVVYFIYRAVPNYKKWKRLRDAQIERRK